MNSIFFYYIIPTPALQSRVTRKMSCPDCKAKLEDISTGYGTKNVHTKYHESRRIEIVVYYRGYCKKCKKTHNVSQTEYENYITAQYNKIMQKDDKL